MSSARVSRRWERWIEAALAKFAFGDHAVWEMSLQLFPPPQGPAIALTVWMPGPVLNTVVQNTVVVGAPTTQTEETVTGAVQQMVRMMHEERSRTLAQQTPPAPNGSGSRLILPS
jgi:hypothetical protein